MARWIKKNQRVVWSTQGEEGFEEPKEMLMLAPVVALSTSNEDVTVSCDASRVELDCVLM